MNDFSIWFRQLTCQIPTKSLTRTQRKLDSDYTICFHWKLRLKNKTSIVFHLKYESESCLHLGWQSRLLIGPHMFSYGHLLAFPWPTIVKTAFLHLLLGWPWKSSCAPYNSCKILWTLGIPPLGRQRAALTAALDAGHRGPPFGAQAGGGHPSSFHELSHSLALLFILQDNAAWRCKNWNANRIQSIQKTERRWRIQPFIHLILISTLTCTDGRPERYKLSFSRCKAPNTRNIQLCTHFRKNRSV